MNARYRLSLFAAIAASCLVAAAAQATTIVLPTDEQLVRKSSVIITGLVISSAPVERDGRIWTETSIAVESQLKGATPGQVVVREVGGIVGERVTRVFGTPVYRAGERVLAFLAPTPRGDYQTVDLLVGKFSEGRTLAGQRLWLRDLEQENVAVLDGTLEKVSSAGVQRDAASFERFIVRREAPADGESYDVVNPVLAGSLRPSSSGFDVRPDFQLIDEPTIYRWTSFDSGASAPWYSTGSQGGYANGGVSELQTAMAAWTSYSAAKILYTYAGQRTAAPGGLNRANGVNEVMFEDPLDEIAGAWNPSAGGVVGQGGFNGVVYGPSWNSPFAADPAHPQRSYASFKITEGNLTIQNGVAPSAGLASARLAEIIAHEFGHTLGLGHSSENASEPDTALSSALMYYRVSGLGASLRADDQVAARWLYPNGNVTPPPSATVPAAPSGLVASVAGTSVTLQWSDNSDNETSFAIFAATGTSGGTFARVGDTGAGARAATLSGFSAGTYRFYVAAVNSAGTSTGSNVASITVSAQLSAAFSVSPALSGVAGATVFTFTDESSGTVDSRLWQFGDGQTSAVASPTHTYAAAGVYTVTLTVNGNSLQSSASKNVSVTAPVVPFVADFVWSPSSPGVGSDVVFTDRTTGGATAWQWNFGDGGASSEQNPVKRYASAGTYDVTLIVYRGTESRVVAKSVSVTSVSPGTPALSASFSFTPVAPAVGENVTFTDTTSGSPTAWNWNFGDGSTSTQRSPLHAYVAAGSYQVSLVASNGATSSSVTRTVSVGGGLAYRTLVSAVAQTSGANGTNWRTELALFNAGEATADVQLNYIPAAGGSKQTRGVTIAPRRTVAWENVLGELFGFSSGAGALEIVASSSLSPELRVSSRTFTGSPGTYGQDVPATDATSTRLYLPGVEASSAFRTNVGFVNSGVYPVSATLTLLDLDGNTVGTGSVSLPPSSFQQSALTSLVPQAGTTSRGGMTLRVESSAAINAYASVVDNRTQDPVFIQGMPLMSGTSLLLPAVGRAPGANATFWRSDVILHNPRAESLGLTLRYIAAGSDGRGAATRNVLVAGGSTNTIADVLSWFNVSSGSGALEITWSGGAGPLITSRTYTSTASGGTYGQSIAPATPYATTAFVTGLRNDASFRSNVGFVNTSSGTNGVSLTLLGVAGETIGTAFVELAPKSQTQAALRDLFGALPEGRFTLVAAGSSPLFAYGSVVDNVSGDPVFYAGR